MDRNLFHKSAQAIKPFFIEMAQKTLIFSPSSTVLPSLRPIGIRAEESMMISTGGINTHRGQIFSLGVCLAAAKRVLAMKSRHPFPGSEILLEAGRICQGITGELDSPGINGEISHGESVYRKLRSTGIRGEAEAGFPTVRLIALPMMKELIENGYDEESAALDVLLHLFEITEDSTVLHRRGVGGLTILKETARNFLRTGGVKQEKGYEKLKEMNRRFVRENISPGGCADLLALTFFIMKIEERLKSGEL
jgi:triphosphoribosyl-dephospho-CoA synthase